MHLGKIFAPGLSNTTQHNLATQSSVHDGTFVGCYSSCLFSSSFNCRVRKGVLQVNMKLGLKRYTSGYYSTTVHRDSKGLGLIGHDVFFLFVLFHFLSVEFLVFLTTSLNATYMGSGKTLRCLLYFIRSIYFQTLSVLKCFLLFNPTTFWYKIEV